MIHVLSLQKEQSIGLFKSSNFYSIEDDRIVHQLTVLLKRSAHGVIVWFQISRVIAHRARCIFDC